MYDNGFSDRLIRATQPTEKKNRETREKDLQTVYEKCRQNIQCSFGEYIRSKISRDVLRRCGISNIDLRYIELSSDSQLYHGGTTWQCGRPYVFTGSIDRLSNACTDSGRFKEDELGVDCVRLFQLDKDRHLLAVNRSAIDELSREWYNAANPIVEEEEETPPSEPPHMDTPVITINGHSTNGDLEENTDSVSKEGEKKVNGAKEEAGKKDVNGAENGSDKKEGNGVENQSNEKEDNVDVNGKDNKMSEVNQNIDESLSPMKQKKEKEPKSNENPELFVRREGLALVDVCFLNERETEFYNVEGIAYEDASSGSSKDILLYHTSATSSISSKDILLFDTSKLRLKQELIVPRRSTKHLVRGQNGYLRCNEPARPRAPPSVRARPVSAGRVGENSTKTWSTERNTTDTKL